MLMLELEREGATTKPLVVNAAALGVEAAMVAKVRRKNRMAGWRW